MERIPETHWIYNDEAVNENALFFPISVRPLFQRICLESRDFPFFMKFKGYFIYTQADDIHGVISWPETLMGDNWMNWRCTIGQLHDRHTNKAIGFLKLDEQFGISSIHDDSPHMLSFLNGQTLVCHTKENEQLPENLPAGEPSLAFDVFSNNFSIASLIFIHNF
jgi:hypothetical protein